MAKRVCIIGSGSWGTAVANVFSDSGHTTTIWGRDASVVDSISKTHENSKNLKGVPLNPHLKASGNLEEVLKNSEIIVNAIPTQQIRSAFDKFKPFLHSKLIINTSKGIEIGTHARVSEIFKALSPSSPYAILSRPSFALETAQRLPTAVTLACKDKAIAAEMREALSPPYFRVYSATDVTGVELTGALKNVVAIASGILSGLKLGYNTQAALINRGLAEMIRIGKKLGAEERTFFGLAGVGDLILTCTGPLSRNRTLGEHIGKGLKVEDAIRALGGVAEGYYSVQSALELAKAAKVEAPITEQIYKILYQGSTPQNALMQLMGRDLKEEW